MMENTVTYALHKPCIHGHGNTQWGHLCYFGRIEKEEKAD